MPLGPLVVTAVLAALDWGAWDWATSSDHSTIGLIAGLLMAPIAVAFAWSLVRVLLAAVRAGLQRASLETRVAAAMPPRTRSDAPFDIQAHDDRLAA